MEYEEENDVPGTVPEFGAIFMSNITTKRECIRRKLLALPSSLANFVKQVKDGMILFLFEFERRELYGVYRACSDGDMNIVPNAFSSSGKQFPAQVRFTPIWYCNPLSEHEFRDAIKDNYYSKKKFTFGLSEDQVRKLLWLFSSRILKKKLPGGRLTRQITKSIGKKRRVDDVEVETEHPENSLANNRRVDDESFFVGNEGGMDSDFRLDISTEYRGSSLDGTGRMTDSDKFWGSDVNYDRRVTRTDSPLDSLDNLRRADIDNRFLTSDRVESEHYIDNDLEPCISTYTGSYVGIRRLADEGRFVLRERVGNEGCADNGFGPISLDKVRRGIIYDSNFRTNGTPDNENNGENYIRPVIYAENHMNHLDKVRRATDNDGFLMNDQLENSSHVNNDDGNGTGPGLLSGSQGSRLSKLRISDDTGFFMNDRVEKEHDLDNGLRPVISSGLFGNYPVRVRGETDDGRFIMSNRVESKCDTDKYTGYSSGIGRVKSDKLENENNMNPHFRSVLKPEYPSLFQSKTNTFIGSSKSISETDYRSVQDQVRHSYALPSSVSEYSSLSQSKPNTFIGSSKPISETNYRSVQDQVRHSYPLPSSFELKPFDVSYPTSQDAIVTRAVPCDFGVAKSHTRRTPSFSFDHSPNPVQDCSTYNSPFESSFTSFKNNLFPYSSEQKGSLLSKSSSSCMHSPRGEIHERESMGPLSLPFSSSMNPTFVFGEPYPVASHEKYEPKLPYREGNGPVFVPDVPPPEKNSRAIYFHEKDTTNHNIGYFQKSESVQSDSQKKRTSVFARLTTAPVVGLQEEEDLALDHTVEIDKSVDEVIESLLRSQGRQTKKTRKSKPLDKQHNYDEISNTTRKTTIDSQMGNNQSRMRMKMKMEVDRLDLTIEENNDQVIEETRVVGFKRRSEINKNKDGIKTRSSVEVEAKTKGSVDNAEAEAVVKKSKRRKLIRPAFDQKESFDEGICIDKAQSLQLVSRESLICKDNPGTRDDSVGGPENAKGSSPNVGLICLTDKTGNKPQNVQLVCHESSICKDNPGTQDDSVGVPENDSGSSLNVGLICLMGQAGDKTPNLQLVSQESSICKDNPGTHDHSVRGPENASGSSPNVGLIGLMRQTGDKPQNLQLVCQESSICKDNRGRHDYSVGGHENDVGSSKNVGLIRLMGRAGSKGYNTNTKQSLKVREKMYSAKCGELYRCEGSTAHSKNAVSSILSEDKNLSLGNHSNSKDSVIGGSVCDAGAINHTSNGQESPPDVQKLNASCQEVGNVNEICQVGKPVSK